MSQIKFGWRAPAFPVDDSTGSTFTDQIKATLDRFQTQFDSAWVADHFIPWARFADDDGESLECLAAICYLAGAFPHIKFGSIVLCQSYRNPALLAKTAATLQLLSGGRFILGIGAGWKEDEYRAYGYEFPKASVRIAQLAEQVQIIRKMWTETPASFQGTYYQIENAYCEPKPDPLPPILIGGGGEQLTLRVVAQHADWWNLPGGTAETYAHKLDVLRAHCDAVGRDYDEIVKTQGGVVAIADTEEAARQIADASPFGSSFVGTPDQVTAQLRTFTDLGVTYFILRFADFPHMDGIEKFTETVMPQFE